MTASQEITDRSALLLHRHRARRMGDDALFLHRLAADEIEERLIEVNRTFTNVVIVTGHPDFWSSRFPHARVVEDEDVLPLDQASCDLVLHAMALHWSNDPVGQLVQARRALKPDGLFLGVFAGGQTASELRASLAEAEVALTGGLSPRVAPMGEIRDLGALLQRAGFALPVADSLLQTATYSSAFDLIMDLRAMGETNALSTRNRRTPPRALFPEMARRYAEAFPAEGNRIRASFDLIFLTGWAPDESQPKPLRPGSATARLADALGTDEQPAGETATPQKIDPR